MKNKKQNLILYISLAVIIVVAIVLFLVGGYLSGWDIAGWFSSSMAIWCYFLVGIYIVVLIIYFLWSKFKKW